MKKYHIIDTHCHIFPEKVAKKATDATDYFYNINYDGKAHKSEFIGDTSALLDEIQESGVDQCIINSVATTPHQVDAINNFIVKEMNLHPDQFIGYGAMHPDRENQMEDAKTIVSLGLKGVKIHPDIQGYKVDCDNALKIFEACEKMNLPILVHTGDKRYDNSNPDRVERILKMFPNLKFIGAHFGGWSVWEEAAEKLSKYDNLFIDTSSSFFALNQDKWKELIYKYGTKRIFFGSDFPMWKQKDEIEYLCSLGLKDEELEDIFSGNIKRLLNL